MKRFGLTTLMVFSAVVTVGLQSLQPATAAIAPHSSAEATLQFQPTQDSETPNRGDSGGSRLIGRDRVRPSMTR